MKFLLIAGTRPEMVKLSPLIHALDAERDVDVQLCVTGQHRDIVSHVLAFFGIKAHYHLDLMVPGQGLNRLAARALDLLDPILAESAPDRVIVQGDTTTAFAAALAAFHRAIPVAHVEAGLRTYESALPFPEEVNRRTIAPIADLHFAPTPAARANLAAERLAGSVYVTGNTGIDALQFVLARIESDAAAREAADAALAIPGNGHKLILVTGHRRESHGAPWSAICAALARLARRPDVTIVCPLHPNPLLRAAAEAALGSLPNVRLLPALDLLAFVRLMQRADLILSDSGGVQEEAVALGKPLIVLRDVTERPEGVAAGVAVMAGTDPERICRAAEARLDGLLPAARRSHIYGDGCASRRIADALLGRPVAEFARDWPRIEAPGRDRLRRMG
jgi:UDP-N-acetylglucosamine 2-epimerase (non-hydrolysing)